MNSHLQISVQKSETINNNTNLYDLSNKTHHLLYNVYIQLEANKKYQPQNNHLLIIFTILHHRL